jgi:predicted RNA methylase
LTKTVEAKRVVLGEIDRENIDFSSKYKAKVNEKDSLRVQICDIEHIIRQLRLEIEQTTTDTKRV